MKNNEKDVKYLKDFLFFLKNAIAFEDHCISSWFETKDKEQLELAIKCRRIRSRWMYRTIKKSKNQIYCESKHSQGCVMGLIEMANRHLENGEIELGEEALNDAGDYEAMFILLNGGNKNV